MKTWLKITFSILGVLVLAVAGLGYYLTRPIEAGHYAAAVAPETREANSVVLTGLAAGGIGRAVADVSDQGVLISYSAPDGADVNDPDTLNGLQSYALGVAGSAAATGTAWIILNDGETPVTMWVADLAKLQDVFAGTMDEATYYATYIEAVDPSA